MAASLGLARLRALAVSVTEFVDTTPGLEINQVLLRTARQEKAPFEHMQYALTYAEAAGWVQTDGGHLSPGHNPIPATQGYYA